MQGIASRLVATILLSSAALAAQAGSPGGNLGVDRAPVFAHPQGLSAPSSWAAWWNNVWWSNDHRDYHDPGPVAAPELDPASALTGLVLLLGGLAVVGGRRKQS